jgi:hypothetical protein
LAFRGTRSWVTARPLASRIFLNSGKAFFVPENGFARCLMVLESTDFRCNPYAGTASKIETVFLS